jgi:hypothetical protein
LKLVGCSAAAIGIGLVLYYRGVRAKAREAAASGGQASSELA